MKLGMLSLLQRQTKGFYVPPKNGIYEDAGLVKSESFGKFKLSLMFMKQANVDCFIIPLAHIKTSVICREKR